MKRQFLASVLSIALVLVGCSTAWVGELDTILAAAAPSLINVLNIVAIAEGKPVNAALEAKITADAAKLKQVAADYAVASAAALPTTCAQVQAAAGVLTADASAVLQIVQVSSASATTNALVVFQAADAIVVTITTLIPAFQAPKPVALAKVQSFSSNKLISNYNAVLVKPTGNVGVDAYNKAHKVHGHSKVARVLSLGMQK